MPQDTDIFKNSDFWLSKGYNIQTLDATKKKKEAQANQTALDYYLTGVRFDARHFGCAYNTACSFFREQMFENACKWFTLALKLQPCSLDSMLGKSVTSLKLGLFDDALHFSEEAVKQYNSSTLYSWE